MLRTSSIVPYADNVVGSPRFAAQLPASDEGLFQAFSSWVGNGAKKGADATRSAATAAQGATGNVLSKHGGKMLKAGGLLSLLSAAGEFSDGDDPLARNALQAGGNLAGGWGGFAGGAALGSAFGPIGTVVGGIAGGIGGTELGTNIAGGIYDFATGQTDADRREQQMIKDANMRQKLLTQEAATRRSIMADDRSTMMPYVKQAMEMKREDDFARAGRELRVQNDYNYANALNQAMLQAQNNNNIQELALTQYMMG